MPSVNLSTYFFGTAIKKTIGQGDHFLDLIKRHFLQNIINTSLTVLNYYKVFLNKNSGFKKQEKVARVTTMQTGDMIFLLLI